MFRFRPQMWILSPFATFPFSARKKNKLADKKVINGKLCGVTWAFDRIKMKFAPRDAVDNKRSESPLVPPRNDQQ